jgi:uncharacterized protein (TIGR03067 family)
MRRLLYLFMVVWLLLAAGGSGAEPKKKDAAAKELAKFQGKWRCIAEDSEGRVDKGFRNGHVIGFEKDIEISYDADGGVACRGSIKLDSSKSPKELDYTTLYNVLYPEDKGKIYRGIYELEGDELKMAVACAPWQRERPKEFTTKKGSHFTVFTYKRVKP